MILGIRNDIMLRVRYVHDTDTSIHVLDACCDTLHDTHYIIINPNYYTNIYVSFYYVWNQILSDTIFDTYMIHDTVNRYKYVSSYYVRNLNIQL